MPSADVPLMTPATSMSSEFARLSVTIFPASIFPASIFSLPIFPPSVFGAGQRLKAHALGELPELARELFHRGLGRRFAACRQSLRPFFLVGGDTLDRF